jgi:hypothetical protein
MDQTMPIFHAQFDYRPIMDKSDIGHIIFYLIYYIISKQSNVIYNVYSLNSDV